MKLNKAQLRLVICLNVVLCTLVCAIVYERYFIKDTAVPPEEQPDAPVYSEIEKPQYEKLRKARISLSDSVLLESNLGGSGNDRLVSAFTANGSIYLFSSTDSSDYDLADMPCSAFLTVLNGDLTTLAFYPIMSGNEILHKVIHAEGGFLCVYSQDNRIKIKTVSYDGNTLISAECDTFGRASFCDAFLTDDGYALITSPYSSPLTKSKLLLQEFDTNLSLSYERLISSPYTLSYLNAYKIGDRFVVFSKAASDLGSHLTVSECTEATEPQTTHIDAQTSYLPQAVLPYSGGWAVSTIQENGEGCILMLDSNFHKQTLHFQSNNCDSSHFSFCNGLYYSGFFSQSESSFVAFNEDLSTKNELSYLHKVSKIISVHTGNDYGIFVTRTENTTAIVGTNESCNLPVNILPCDNAKVLRLGDSFYLTSTVTGNNDTVAECFGSADVWIAKLQI